MADLPVGSALQRLPHELIYHVLSLCSDPMSLRSLSRSCAAFYAVFKAGETKITSTVLSLCIHPSVQRDAHVTLAASRLSPDDPNEFEQFIDEQLQFKDEPHPLPWTLHDAVDAVRFHDHVHHLAHALAHQILRGDPFTAPTYGGRTSRHGDRDPDPASSPAPSATTSEINRFQRALYRFQTFCELLTRETGYEEFCKHNGLATSPDVWLACYSEFATYEIEQLSCLNDLLMALVAQSFNQIVLHDVTWGHLGVRLITSESSRLGQQVLSRGLETLRALSEATTYSAYRKILHLGETQDDRPAERRNFLIDRFDDSDGRQYLGHIGAFDDLSPELKAKLIRRPFYPDPDPGSAQLWEKVHLSEGIPIGLVAVHQFRHYRRWGYVFWDEARLDKLGVFDEGWDEAGLSPAAPEDPFLIFWEIDTKDMAASRRIRSRIWGRGGRGYWSPGDESKVIYSTENS